MFDGKRIVTVGTVCERKAQHVLVEAAARLAKDRRDFVCYLVGAREGLPYLSYVRNLIRARGLEDVVLPVTEVTLDSLAQTRVPIFATVSRSAWRGRFPVKVHVVAEGAPQVHHEAQAPFLGP